MVFTAVFEVSVMFPVASISMVPLVASRSTSASVPLDVEIVWFPVVVVTEVAVMSPSCEIVTLLPAVLTAFSVRVPVETLS